MLCELSDEVCLSSTQITVPTRYVLLGTRQPHHAQHVWNQTHDLFPPKYHLSSRHLFTWMVPLPTKCPVFETWEGGVSDPFFPFTSPTYHQLWSHRPRAPFLSQSHCLVLPIAALRVQPIVMLPHLHILLLVSWSQDCTSPARSLTRDAHLLCRKGVRDEPRCWVPQPPRRPGRAPCIHPSMLHRYPLSACVLEWERWEAPSYRMSVVWSQTARGQS